MIQGTPEQILAFAKEFVSLQSTLPPLPRTREGQEGNRTFNYTEFDTVLEVIQPLLKSHGFAHYEQCGSSCEGGFVATVDVYLIHKDGGFITTSLRASVDGKNAIRDAGKAHTYFRRYGLVGLLGMASESDQDAPDLNTQKRQEPPKQTQKKQDANPGRAKAEEILGKIKVLVHKAASTKEQAGKIMEEIAAHSRDAHGKVPSLLARDGEVYKLDEVLRWAENVFATKQDHDDIHGEEDAYE